MKMMINKILACLCGLVLTFVLPQTVSAQTAITTFASIGLYWSPANGSSSLECQVQYRQQGASIWKQGYPLWFDPNDREYRGSLVNLNSNTTYEIQLKLPGTSTQANLTAKTWSEDFPVGKTVYLPQSSSNTINITESGTISGYILYAPESGKTATIDASNSQNYNIVINAGYIIIRNLNLKGAKNSAIKFYKGAHDVVIEGNDISNWGTVWADGWGVTEDSALSLNVSDSELQN